MEVSGQFLDLVTLHWTEIPWFQLERRLGGSQPVWMYQWRENIPVPARNGTPEI